MSEQVKERPVLPIDPRIRARRVQVTRSEGRRRLRVLLMGTAVVAVLGASVGVTRSPILDLDRIQLAGARHTPRAQVLSAARLDDHPQMIDIDSRSVVRRLERLPWVKTAAIERRWPGTVVLHVSERTPVAVVADGPRWLLVDATGRFLQIVPYPPDGLPRLSGTVGAGAPGERIGADLVPITEMVADLTDDVASLAAEIVVDDGDIELRSGARSPVVKLGPPVEIPAKIRALRAVLTGANMARVNVIDVRVPTAPVLTRG